MKVVLLVLVTVALILVAIPRFEVVEEKKLEQEVPGPFVENVTMQDVAFIWFEDNRPLIFTGLMLATIVSTFLSYAPTIIGRNKKNCRAIFALNLFGGWTFVGWVIALVWACTQDSKEDQEVARPLRIDLVLLFVVVMNVVIALGVLRLVDQAYLQAP